MRHVLITSMLALGVSCGAALAQSEQPADNQSGANTNCTTGAANCQKKDSKGEQTQGKAGASTEQQTQGNMKAQTNKQAQGKSGTTTEQQAQGKSETNCPAGRKNCKQGSNTGEQAQGKTGATTNQAPGKAQTQANEQAQGKTGTTSNQAQGNTNVQNNEQAQGKTGATTNQAQGTQTNEQDQGKTASINNVTVEQKTQITSVIKESNVEPVSNIDFDISVGVEIPRQKVKLHRLPSRIVKIVPAYEGYEYFVLADGRIVIVDPNTYKIVLVLS
ncbi:DUF1236 domain-containing protein [Mesorhizobium sp. MSK_1335]|uniref:DUF1236 domain-containing protein n=1 Tax=Mesorhizobium montanum TaxID=3072323 RepID=A0ABU4ZYI8_9HYPH|nr:DUF1236 domain-containing protein [Mesorhizobium sp. MSK_1335]MDX8528986.1 DUF1236 domain-containing protein [Mesorhizobium sp. MSK_1335]